MHAQTSLIKGENALIYNFNLVKVSHSKYLGKCDWFDGGLMFYGGRGFAYSLPTSLAFIALGSRCQPSREPSMHPTSIQGGRLGVSQCFYVALDLCEFFLIFHTTPTRVLIK